MPIIEMPPEQAAARFWEGMREVAAAATRHGDEELLAAFRKIGSAAMSQGVPVASLGGLFATCPVCDAEPGQSCISAPGHPLPDGPHPERIERTMRELAGEEPVG
ncbi:zinc finger domain-containing protein [Micromonospora sp. NPDC005113]